jgi:HlyD family secretion protein
MNVINMEEHQVIQMKEKLKKNKWKRFLVIFSLIVIVFLVLKSVFVPKEDVETETAEQVAVVVETIKLGQESTDISILERTAIFRSASSGDVVTENTGRIRQVNFEIGDYVKKGQTLAVFDQSSMENTLKSNLNSAQSALEIAIDNSNQTRKVVEENLELAKNARKIAKMQYENAQDNPTEDEDIAKRVYENAKDSEEQAEANVEIQKNQADLQVNQARTVLENAKVAFSKTVIKAPISGKVVSKNISVDEYVGSGSRIAGIVGEGKLEATVSLNTDQISRIKTGDEVEIEIDDNVYEGKVVSLSKIATSASQRFGVKVETKRELSTDSNQNGKVRFSLAIEEDQEKDGKGPREEVFFVPISSVNLGQRRTVVFLKKDNKAVSQEVKAGEIIGEKIEIVEGLAIGDELIVVNSRNLQDGQTITTEKNVK